MPEWNEILIMFAETLTYLVVACIIPIVVKIIKDKIASDKNLADIDIVFDLIDIASNLVIKCCNVVNQTFVDDLKSQGAFDSDSQKEAFKMCKDMIMSMLNDAAKEAIISVHKDLDAWIDSQIENPVKVLKEVPKAAA